MRCYRGDKRTSRAPGTFVFDDRRAITAPLCPARHPPQSIGLARPSKPSNPLSMGSKSRAIILRHFGPGGGRAVSGSAQATPTGWPSRLGASACSASEVRLSRRPRWGMRSMGTAISKSAALAATRTRPLPSTSCGDRGQRRSMNWNATSAARTAQVRGHPYKRSHLVALRATKITASDPPSHWRPAER